MMPTIKTMFSKAIVACLCAFLVQTTITTAEPPTAMTVQECVKAALASSPVLAVAETDIEAASGMLTESAAALKPGLRLGGTARHYDQNRGVHSGAAPGATQFYDQDIIEMQLQIRQLIWDAGRSKAKLSAARNLLDARKSQRLHIEQELLYSVLISCIDIINFQAQAEAVEKNIQDINAALQRIRKLQEVGKVASVDVLRVEVREQEVFSQRETVTHLLNLTLARLTRITGMAQTPSAIASASLENLVSIADNELEMLIELALNQRPDLTAQKAKIAAARNEYKAADRGQQPTLNAVLSGNRYSAESGDSVANGFAGLEFTWQFSDGGQSQGKKRIAKAAVDKEKILLHDAKLKVAEQVRTAFSAISAAVAKLARSQKGLSLAEEAYRIELLNYEHGKGTVNDLLDAQSALFTARAQLIRDENDLLAARLAMLLATGQPIL